MTAIHFVAVGAGYLLSKYIPDETQWYQKQFLILTTALLIAATISVAFTRALTPLFIVLGLAGLATYALASKFSWLFFLSVAGMQMIIAAPWLDQITILAVIPATGYLYSSGVRNGLWWSAVLLVPTVITFIVFA